MTTRRKALEWPAAQLGARAVILLGPVLGLAAAAAADIPPPGWFAALVVALALGWALLPESVLGTMALALVVAWWGAAGLGDLPAAAMPAAVALLAAHLAAVVVSYGPPELELDAPTVRLWLTRGAALCAAAPGVWLLAEVMRGRPEPPGVWVAAMVAIVVAAVIAAVAFGPPQEEPAGDP